jgi:hypothetical protein
MIVTSASHLDHALTPAVVAYITARFAGRDAFFIETITLPYTHNGEALPEVPCGLHGPLMGDAPIPESECTYQVRGERPGPSRMTARPVRTVRTLTVIAGPHEGEPCVLYTAFGGPSAPREPFDAALQGPDASEAKAASVAFWGEHALSL